MSNTENNQHDRGEMDEERDTPAVLKSYASDNLSS